MYCKTCIHKIGLICTSQKISEDLGFSDDESKDMLIYSYSEGGTFQVGDLFGCVHHEKKTKTQ